MTPMCTICGRPVGRMSPGDSAPSPAPSRSLWAPLTVLGVLQVVDVWTTWTALGGGGREGNPIAAAILLAGGFAALACVKLAMYLNAVRAAGRLTSRGKFAWALNATCILSIIYSVVVLSNTLHILNA